MIKKVGFLITALIIVGVLLYIVPIRHKINTTLEGIQCRIGDKGYSENISVTLQGNYFSYLFKADSFEGKILIDKYDYTLNGSWVFPLRLTDGWIPLTYQNNKNGVPALNTLGSIYCTHDLKQVLIWVYEIADGDSQGVGADKGLFIIAPSENRSQAIDLVKNMSKRNHEISLINWY